MVQINAKSLLKEGQVLLIVVPSEKMPSTVISLSKEAVSSNLAYFTMSKSADIMVQDFKKNKISLERVLFVDGISKTFKNAPDQDKYGYYVASPGDLTGISVSLSKLLKHEFKSIIFDSLNNLLVYRDYSTLNKFFQHTVMLVRENKASMAILAVDTSDSKSIIENLGMIVDKVIRL